MTNASAVIVAAGRGVRMGSPKQFLPLGGIPIVDWSIRTFSGHPAVDEVVVVLPAESAAEASSRVAGEHVRCCVGGETRRQSAGAGVRAVSPDAQLILIHDAARPFISPDVIDRVIAAASRTGAALPVLSCVDTIKRIQSGRIVDTIERSGLGRAQTPQGFRAGLIRQLHTMAARRDTSASDDVALCELEGYPVEAVDGDPWNLKITTPADLALAQWLLQSGTVVPPIVRS